MDSTFNLVILAGGAGTRLWPMSDSEQPKQFQKLLSEKTMLQETLDRIRSFGLENIYISSNEKYRDLIREQTPEIPEDHWILEPCMRDTAPGIGLITAQLYAKDPKAVVAIVYADHFIRDAQEFRRKLQVGANWVGESGQIAMVEVKATEPNTNLGYVKIGHLLEEKDDVEFYEFLEFKEKPDLETAKRFVSSYQYLWNTGYYIFRVDTLLEEYQKHLPQTHAVLQEVIAGKDIRSSYETCEKISFDYGIMEKIDPKRVRIIPAALGWNDIGTWASLFEELSESKESNVLRGKNFSLDCQGCLVYNASDSILTSFGLKDTIIVQNEKGTLICSKEKSRDLKALINLMKQ